MNSNSIHVLTTKFPFVKSHKVRKIQKNSKKIKFPPFHVNIHVDIALRATTIHGLKRRRFFVEMLKHSLKSSYWRRLTSRLIAISSKNIWIEFFMWKILKYIRYRTVTKEYISSEKTNRSYKLSYYLALNFERLDTYVYV